MCEALGFTEIYSALQHAIGCILSPLSVSVCAGLSLMQMLSNSIDIYRCVLCVCVHARARVCLCVRAGAREVCAQLCCISGCC